MTGARDESVVASEGKKARIEAHQIAFVLGNSSGQIVEPEFTRAALERVEGMDMTADERLEVLAMRELQVHLPAVAFDQAERIQLAWRAVVHQSSKVAPVDIETFAGAGLHANVSAARGGAFAHGVEVVFEDRDAP